MAVNKAIILSRINSKIPDLFDRFNSQQEASVNEYKQKTTRNK